MASTTKIMTTLLALENGNLSDMVTFSDDAINNTEGSGIARDYGEQMTLEQCLYGVKKMERATRFELATSTLARWRSAK